MRICIRSVEREIHRARLLISVSLVGFFFNLYFEWKRDNCLSTMAVEIPCFIRFPAVLFLPEDCALTSSGHVKKNHANLTVSYMLKIHRGFWFNKCFYWMVFLLLTFPHVSFRKYLFRQHKSCCTSLFANQREQN